MSCIIEVMYSSLFLCGADSVSVTERWGLKGVVMSLWGKRTKCKYCSVHGTTTSRQAKPRGVAALKCHL